MKNKNNASEQMKRKRVLIIVIILLIILIIGSTYAILQTTVNGEKKSTIVVGTLSLNLDESASDGINVQTATPVTDNRGLETTPYKFTLENTGNVESEYTIYLDDDEIEENDVRIDDNFIKYNLVKDSVGETGKVTQFGINPNRVIDSGVIEAGESKNYELRLWIDNDATNDDIIVQDSTGKKIGKVFSTKLRIEASQIKE